jgi:very-short-patch-repair endonuclease
MHYSKIKELAAEFRKHPTKAEQYLWTFLRKRKLSEKKFLRQHPIIYEVIGRECFFFIPDFYCFEHKLVIELDGGVHDTRVQKDLHRDLILKNLGLTIIRIHNSELSNIETVLHKISENFT